jgi:hypothetical protein
VYGGACSTWTFVEAEPADECRLRSTWAREHTNVLPTSHAAFWLWYRSYGPLHDRNLVSAGYRHMEYSGSVDSHTAAGSLGPDWMLATVSALTVAPPVWEVLHGLCGDSQQLKQRRGRDFDATTQAEDRSGPLACAD